jgi:protein-tyrosine-phosphatase/predicted ATP-grasp superfamily ATP-dependent carboligase
LLFARIHMKRPTLILGFEPRITIPIARSLNNHNIRVTVATFAAGAKTGRSRAIHETVVVPNPCCEPDRFWSAFAALIRAGQFDFLIPCGDLALVAIAPLYEQLNRLLYVSCPPPQIVKRVLDKRVTLAVARQCNVPIPTTFCIASLDELEIIRHDLVFPIICKPPSKQLENPYKVRYFSSYEELRGGLASSELVGREVLLQRYCDGDGVGVETLIHKREPIALFQHRRIREFPSTGGVSVVAVSEPLDARLADFAVTLLRSLEWEGVAMVEFKYDRANRTAMLMEVNGRYWGSLALPIHAGIDFPFYAWQLAHGQQPKVPSSYPAGLRMRWATGDFIRLHDVVVNSSSACLPRLNLLRELAHFLWDFLPSTRPALWSIRDPLPALCEFGRAVKGIAISDTKQIIKRLMPSPLEQHIRTSRILDRRAGNVYLKLQLLRLLRLRRGFPRRIPPGVKSILFVCHGNLIRSPMAAALLRRRLFEENQSKRSVISAGVYAKQGKKADPRAVAAAREFGISMDDHRTQQVTPELIDQSDLIFVADYLNEARLLAHYPKAKHKVFLLGTYADRQQGSTIEIADPYDGNLADIRRCYQILDNCIGKLTDDLKRVEQAEGYS